MKKVMKERKRKNKGEKWADHYDRVDILDEITEEPLEFSLDEHLLRDILEKKRKRMVMEGEVPSAVTVLPGCRFHPRCGYAGKRCTEEEPVMREVESGHSVACHLV